MACRITSPLRVAAGDMGDLPPIMVGGRVGRRLRCVVPSVVPSGRPLRGRGLPVVQPLLVADVTAVMAPARGAPMPARAPCCGPRAPAPHPTAERRSGPARETAPAPGATPSKRSAGPLGPASRERARRTGPAPCREGRRGCRAGPRHPAWQAGRFLPQFAGGRGGQSLAGVGQALGDVPARGAGGVAEQDMRPVRDQDAAGRARRHPPTRAPRPGRPRLRAPGRHSS